MSYPSMKDRHIDPELLLYRFEREKRYLQKNGIPHIEGATAHVLLQWLEDICPKKNAKWEGALQVASIIERAGYFTFEYRFGDYLSAVNRLSVAVHKLNGEFTQTKLGFELINTSPGQRDRLLPVYFLNV